MSNQIRPTRLEVSDRFPMLGFAIRTDGQNRRYEVAVATEPGLFQPDAKTQRSRSTFFSSRVDGTIPAGAGEAVYVMPPEVLARFAGKDRLYFALATYSNGKESPEISSIPTSDSPYVNIKGLSGRSLQRVRFIPNRSISRSGYEGGNNLDLEWAGDAIMPGVKAIAPKTSSGPDSGGEPALLPNTSAASALSYNDGFGPLPPPAVNGPDPVSSTNGRVGLMDLATQRGIAPLVSQLLDRGVRIEDIRLLIEALPCKSCDQPISQPVASGKPLALSSMETLTDQDELSIQLLSEKAAALEATSRGLVFDSDDVESAKRLVPLWIDLIKYRVPSSLQITLQSRDMQVQPIENAIGDLNVDFYPIRITSLPAINGATIDGDALLQYVRVNFNSFVDTSNSEFAAYDPAIDGPVWTSTTPDGSVIFIDIAGPDNASVVASGSSSRRWIFSPIRTPRSGEHPVSGNREFGYFRDKTGDLILFSRAADRTTGALETIGDFISYGAADQLWQSFQDKVVAFVNANGGAARIEPRISKRLKWSVVNDLSEGLSTGLSYSRALSIVPIPADQAKPVKLPLARETSAVERFAIETGLAALTGPAAPLIAALRAAAAVKGVSVAIGPAASVGFVLGMGVGAGVIFTSDGKIGVYGKFEVSGGILDSLSAGLQVTVVRGGIAEFNEVAFAVGGAFVEGIAAIVQVLFSPEHGFRGVSVEVGLGLAIEPIEIFVSVEGSLAEQIAGELSVASSSEQELRLAPSPTPVLRAEALGTGMEIVSVIVGAAMERITSYEGNIGWELDQLRGLKHPRDVAPAANAPNFRDAPSIRLDDWPFVETVSTDRISAWFSVDWQFNGSSLGNVRITNVGTNGALLNKLHVSARIMDDNIVYGQSNPGIAALRIRLHYRFERLVGSDAIAIRDLHLFGDGTFESSGTWEQY